MYLLYIFGPFWAIFLDANSTKPEKYIIKPNKKKKKWWYDTFVSINVHIWKHKKINIVCQSVNGQYIDFPFYSLFFTKRNYFCLFFSFSWYQQWMRKFRVICKKIKCVLRGILFFLWFFKYRNYKIRLVREFSSFCLFWMMCAEFY